jgi:hypothetical protein
MADIRLKSLLNELTFRNQTAFDKYNSAHKLRNSTKVTINGKETTAGQAEKKTKKKQKPNNMYSGDYAKDRGDKSSKKTDTTRKQGWKRERGAPYAEDDKFWADRFLPGDKVAGDIASEDDFNMYRTAKIGISLNDWFASKDKKDFKYNFTSNANGSLIVSSENGPINFVMFSDDKDGSFNFGFTDNEDGEFIYENPDSTSSRDNGTFGGSNHFDDPQYVYQSMRYIMAQPETIQLLRGEITTREYKPMYEKFKKELELSKKTNENKMKNITLKSLLEAEDFQARSKETGKLVHFKSKDAYQAAIKAGSHENPNAKKGEQPKAAAKSNSMFGGDYAKDRGAKTTSNASVDGQTDDELYDALYDMGYDFGELGSDDFDENGFADAAMNLGYRWDDKNKVWNHRDTMGGSESPKSTPTPKMSGNWKPDEDGKLSSDAADDVRNYLNDVIGVDGMAEIDYNTGNIQYGLSDGENSIFVGNDGGTYNVSFEGPSMDLDKIEQSYKSFKNPKDALLYAGELAKANRKGLEQKQESTKLTSMIKK